MRGWSGVALIILGLALSVSATKMHGMRMRPGALAPNPGPDQESGSTSTAAR